MIPTPNQTACFLCCPPLPSRSCWVWCSAVPSQCADERGRLEETNLMFGTDRRMHSQATNGYIVRCSTDMVFYYVSTHFIWGRHPQFICIKMLARLGTFQRMWSSLLNARVMLEALVSRSQVKSFNNPLREKALVPALIASTRWFKENIKSKVYK